MSYVVVRLTVEDTEKWKAGFQQAASLRKSYGSKGARAFFNADNPNEVLVLGESKMRRRPARCSSRRHSATPPNAPE